MCSSVMAVVRGGVRYPQGGFIDRALLDEATTTSRLHEMNERASLGKWLRPLWASECD